MTHAVAGRAGLGERLGRQAGMRSLDLGELRISYVPDGAVEMRPTELLPDTDHELWAGRPEFLNAAGHLVGSIGALLVEHGDRALLIDAGFGPRSWPPAQTGPQGPIRGGALVENLAALGRGPEEIEAIAFTHLHPDHIGWACRPSPVFDRAAYLVAEPEWAERATLAAQGLGEEIAALAPRVRTVADGEEIFPGVRLRVTAGHTHGHAEYVIASGGRRLVAFGDALHSPLQVEHPEWSSGFDHDPALAAAHRHALVAELARPGTIGFGGHFADVVFGTVGPAGAGHVWRPLG
ncbi:MBL fold metallo-hydrolase [Streptomyces sp. VRA16 Mangrove soil]|uniref:MBL fold metallo-hydrolase n=1 Tax=Streptomyces sp. VRA16 Mangrove soil TaxID=2817434 RepID=UPI001A9CD6BE|nr:MBL fold metallo-hydrolase [Streptomyces sp. VRA16 Mangrove soil]MBO1336142.1 MBL fold metallo-hydrolase [Streptomyces sp. VRA16 Mangrove soil]